MLWDRTVPLGLSEPALPIWQPDPSQGPSGVKWLAEGITGDVFWLLGFGAHRCRCLHWNGTVHETWDVFLTDPCATLENI